ncbi:MAG: hypothetical protein HON53_02400, partial [Planctomycetaceae bacterium]|nr:hypothetical protein [Planctomycetaceae bacterium]
MSYLNWRERWALICRLKLKERFLGKAAKNSPPTFRRELLLSEHETLPFGARIQPWQHRDFCALDPAWQQLAGSRESRVEGLEPDAAQPPQSSSGLARAYIERPRGHAKTSDMAIQIAWILLFAKRRIHGLAAAADRDQASLIWDAVRRIGRANPRLCQDLQFRKHLIVNRRTDSRLDIISSDVQSSWGALPDFVICDELCHWEKPDMWFSLLSSAAKRPNCVLVVLTNAGVGRGWQWEVREAARNSAAWYFSSISGAQAPWITTESLREQQELLPNPVYERLWQNVWQHSDGEFVTLEEAEACCNPALSIQERGQPRRQYVAAIDYAEKHDYTVGVIVHREGDKIIVDRLDVVVPRPGQPTKIAWVEDWMNRVIHDFDDVTFVFDDYQLLGTIQKMETRAKIERFQFGGGRGNHDLAVNL